MISPRRGNWVEEELKKSDIYEYGSPPERVNWAEGELLKKIRFLKWIPPEGATGWKKS